MVAAVSVVLPAANESNIYPIRYVIVNMYCNQLLFSLTGQAIACIHNLFNFSDSEYLVLDRRTLARIFAGEITQWSSADIASTNSGIDLPDSAIVVVPFDDPDVAAIMVAALTKFDPTGAFGTLLQTSASDTINSVISTPNSISCVPYTDSLAATAHIVAMINANGTVLLRPDEGTIISAMNQLVYPPAPSEFYLLDAPGLGSWPICVYIYVLIRVQDYNCTELSTFTQFVEWALTKDAQSEVGLTSIQMFHVHFNFCFDRYRFRSSSG